MKSALALVGGLLCFAALVGILLERLGFGTDSEAR
jgi:hypothetical protein